MDFDAIIELLEEKLNTLKKELNSKDEKFEFFKSFPYTSIQRGKEPQKFEVSEEIVTALFTINSNVPFDIVKKSIKGNIDVFGKLHPKILNSIFNNLAYVINSIGFDETINLIYGSGKLKGNLKLKRKKILILAINGFSPNSREFLNLYKEDFENTIKCVALLINIHDFNIDFDNISTSLKFLEKDFTKTVKEVLNTYYMKYGIFKRIDEIQVFYRAIETYGYNIIKEKEVSDRTKRKQIGIYETIINWLYKNKDTKEIFVLPTELSKLDEDTRLNILKFIHSKSKNYYKELSNKYKNLSTNHSTNYILTFQKYGIDITENEINLERKLADINEILFILNSLNFKDKKIIIDITNNCDISNLRRIKKLVTADTISKEFVINNSDILLDRYDNFSKNINYINSKKISNTNIKVMEDALIIEHNKLKNNFKILEEYKLFDQKQVFKNFNMLNEPNLEDKIDLLLRLGYEELLCNELGLLEIDYNKLKRLIVLKQLNIPIDNLDDLHRILDTNKFAVADSNLDSYIYIKTINNDELNSTSRLSNEEFYNLSKESFLEKLNQFSKTSRTYNFDGVIISKNKVNRNLDSIEKDNISLIEQVYTLVSGNYLDDLEYSKIVISLTAKNKQMKKV